MAFSGMLRRVALLITDVSEELGTFLIRVTSIGELGTTLDVTINRRTLRSNTAVKTSNLTYRENLQQSSVKNITQNCTLVYTGTVK
jgi:hypothetical protein